jgi:hypothetical protein
MRLFKIKHCFSEAEANEYLCDSDELTNLVQLVAKIYEAP